MAHDDKLFRRWRDSRKPHKALQTKQRNALHQLRGPELDERAAETHEQVFKELDCLQCANCCQSIPPIVNRTDASRLARHLRMSEGSFHREYLRVDEDGDTVMSRSPCPFLQADHRCAVYDVRPKACRSYPHTDENFSRNLDLHIQNSAYCPAVFAILERLVVPFAE